MDKKSVCQLQNFRLSESANCVVRPFLPRQSHRDIVLCNAQGLRIHKRSERKSWKSSDERGPQRFSRINPTSLSPMLLLYRTFAEIRYTDLLEVRLSEVITWEKG